MANFTINFSGYDTIATAQTKKAALKKALGLLLDATTPEYQIDIEQHEFMTTLYAYNPKTSDGAMMFVYNDAKLSANGKA